ncbi:MAG TPA: ABC transporter substrate-binding protein [Acidimicrobiales bacterium]|jgi:peptide/nickel transport system substrate-binding protein|nr:ABC transporter substrate-binding protein [Acidimicrobiales bacterium]
MVGMARARRRWQWVACVGVAAALLAASCGDDNGGGGDETSASSTSAQATTTTAAPKSGGSLTLGTFTETPSLDPVTNIGTGVTGGMELVALYDTLMQYNTTSGKYEPRLAQSLTANADLSVWTLKLRPNIKFTDGTAYDAAAVVFNLKRHIDLKGRSLGLVSFMKSFDTPDPLTVVITLNAPNSTVPFTLSSAPGAIASPAVIQAQGANFGINPLNAGAGPFTFSSFKPKEAVVLKKNPNYWNGPVYLDELRFVNVIGQAQNLEALKSGQLQGTLLRDPVVLAAAKDAGYTGLEAAQSAGNTITMNNGVKVTCSGGQPAPACTGQADGASVATKTATSNKLVRQAVAAAINLDTLNARVWQGKAELSTALLAKTSKWNSNIAGPKFDLDQAKKLVNDAKAAGWDGNIRLFCHNGLPDWGVAVQTMLEQAGFKVSRTDNQPVADVIASVVTKHDFDIACFGVSILDEEPFSALTREYSFTGYSNPDVDAALKAGPTYANDADKQKALDTIAKAYTADVPFLSISPAIQLETFAKNVRGAVQSVNSIVFYDKAWLA